MNIFMLKKLPSFMLIICITAALISLNIAAQDMESPVSQNAGRIVKLKKTAVTHDENGNFIFKNPHNILAIENGGFFLEDNGRILKFAADGSFIKIVVSKGEGPGEATYLIQLYKRDNELIVNTGFMRKLMVFNFDGELKGEYRERMTKKSLAKSVGFSEVSYQILAHKDDSSLLVLRQTFSFDKKDKIRRNYVFLLSANGEWLDRLFDIPLDCKIIDMGGGEKLMLPKISVISAYDRQILYFCNTERYDIKKYNIKQGKIEAHLKRRYKPITIPKEIIDDINYGGTLVIKKRNEKTKIKNPPKPKFFHDIVRLYVVNGQLWVMTSTFDKEKGVLFDVYNRDGDYIDYFYISLPGVHNEADFIKNEIHIFKSYLFKKETDEEGNFMVVKYEIVDNAKVASAGILQK